MPTFCSLFSGSSGNCLFLKSDHTKILIDAGLSFKKIFCALSYIGENPSELSGILISHEHSDHIRGAGITSRKLNIPIYATSKTWEELKKTIGDVDNENIKYFSKDQSFDIGDICINPFSIPHDAVDPVGFNFFINNKKVTTATDIGHINDTLLKNFENSDLLFIEANHDIGMLKMGRYPWDLKMRILGDNGHLSNEVAGDIVVRMTNMGTTKFLLGHLSHENNFPELAFQTVYNKLCTNNIKINSDIFLEIALRDKIGNFVFV